MRIALCLSGQSRFVEEGYYFLFKNLFDFKNIDVFVHTWEDNECDKVLDFYNPISYIIEPQRYDITFDNKNLDYKQENANSGNFVHYSMFYSMKKSNELKLNYETENNFKYDCVIKSRFDNALLNELDVASYNLSNLNAEFILQGQGVTKLSDWFLFSNSHNIDVMCMLHDKMPLYEKQKVMMNSGEELLTHHIALRQIPCDMINVNLKLIREYKTDIPRWIFVDELKEIKK